MNVLSVSGHLGRDPVLKNLPNGDALCELTVPATTGYGDKKKTTWIQATVFGKRAEACAANLRKGQFVVVVGPFYAEAYISRDTGEARAAARMRVLDISWGTTATNGTAAPAQAAAPARPAAAAAPPRQPAQPAPAQTDSFSDIDDDIPF